MGPRSAASHLACTERPEDRQALGWPGALSAPSPAIPTFSPSCAIPVVVHSWRRYASRVERLVLKKPFSESGSDHSKPDRGGCSAQLSVVGGKREISVV